MNHPVKKACTLRFFIWSVVVATALLIVLGLWSNNRRFGNWLWRWDWNSFTQLRYDTGPMFDLPRGGAEYVSGRYYRFGPITVMHRLPPDRLPPK